MPSCLEPGLSFVKLAVNDPETATAFYKAVVGLEVAVRIDGGTGENAFHEYVLARPEGGAAVSNLLLMHYYNRPPSQAADVTVGFVVPDVAEAFAAALAAGASVVTPVTELPDQGLRLCFFRDPEGYTVELLEFLRTGA